MADTTARFCGVRSTDLVTGATSCLQSPPQTPELASGRLVS